MITTDQGYFVSTGKAKTLTIKSGVDWMEVRNLTVASASQTSAIGVEYYWQKGFATDSGMIYKKSNSSNAANLTSYVTSGGFTLVDSSEKVVGPLNATISSISAAAVPVVTNTGVNGLSPGDVVRLTNVAGALQLNGLDFTVGHATLTNTTFSLDYMSQIAAATTGAWSKVIYPSPSTPPALIITKISSSLTARVHTSVAHSYNVGSFVRLIAPAMFGSSGKLTKIIRVSNDGANTYFDVDLDTTGYPLFSFPASGSAPYTPPQVIPVGSYSTAVSIKDNKAILGMSLAPGLNSPGGEDGDEIYWRSGTASKITMEK